MCSLPDKSTTGCFSKISNFLANGKRVVYDCFMDSKTTGYVFLSTGVFIMVFSTVLVILAFTNIIHPTYFSVSPKSTPFPTPNTDLNSLNSTGQPNLSALLPSLNIIPPGVLDNALNLSAHFLLMTFIGGFGHKLAMIGVNLIRPIVIKTGDKIIPTEDTPPQA